MRESFANHKLDVLVVARPERASSNHLVPYSVPFMSAASMYRPARHLSTYPGFIANPDSKPTLTLSQYSFVLTENCDPVLVN